MSAEDGRLDAMVAKEEQSQHDPTCRDCEVGEPHTCPQMSAEQTGRPTEQTPRAWPENAYPTSQQLYDWWDDAVAAANLRAQVHGRRQTVCAAGDLWVVQEVGA